MINQLYNRGKYLNSIQSNLMMWLFCHEITERFHAQSYSFPKTNGSQILSGVDT